ncbi:2'-5' RNA ligase family protein [Sporosarcina sp. NPDC096371]|uniref:2'-5' RNA ligase family protein n=1 Tax=Sporosarcina sp. NPDC096371 TaxID=3364530 RepID=UPI003826128E
MYAIIAVFDEKTEQIIKDIWKELKDLSISFYAYEVENRKPHITLASYMDINIAEYVRQMEVFYKDQESINVSLNSIGSFMNSGTLFFSPTVTKDLFELHSDHHKEFKQFNDDPSSLYLPDRWIPHCTIANRLSPEKLSEAFNYCSKRNNTLFAQIKEIALIDVSDKSKAPIIFTMELKK